MKKICNRCAQPFMCREDRVDVCHCKKVHLTNPMREFVRENYQDCLCGNCLKMVKDSFESYGVNPIYAGGEPKVKAE